MSEQTGQPTHKQFNDPVSVSKRSKQKIHFVARRDKAAMLEHIIKSSDLRQVVVITKTKRDADALSAYLETQSINATAIHANKREQENVTAAKAFSEDELNILITTDMTPSGINCNKILLHP